jgi:hypothetical protein
MESNPQTALQTLDFVADALRNIRYQPGFQQFERERLFRAFAEKGLFAHLMGFMEVPRFPEELLWNSGYVFCVRFLPK